MSTTVPRQATQCRRRSCGPPHRSRSCDGAPSTVAPRSGDGAGNRDTSNGEQLFDVKLKADAEHQQNDADFGKLFGDFRVGDESGSVRADQSAGKQIADDRGEAGAMCEVTQNQGGGEAAGQRQDQIQVVHRRIVLRQIHLSRCRGLGDRRFRRTAQGCFARLLASHPFVPP